MSSASVTPMPEGLYVQTLGQFLVWHDGEVLPEQRWQRKTARQLFQYLLTSSKNYISKESITVDLWPELSEEKADRDFKVALNALNNTLEPNREPRATPRFVLRHGTSYTLNWQAPILTDTAEFERLLKLGSQAESSDALQAIQLYQEALDLYGGDFLPNSMFEDWASLERERMTTLYLTSASRLASLLEAQNNIVEMLIWCQKVIAIDPCWEEAYRLMMSGYTQNNNRPQAIRTYDQCVAALEQELGIEPMTQTTQLYESIKSGNWRKSE